ncbi:MAG TPA: hypothetical protein VGP37_03225 [Candidatus Nanopelagicales bacterium]|nr:hypothetical protein [Candidatus Nanopelagicales bacterium]
MNRPVSLTIAVVLQWIAAVFYIIVGVGILLSGFATLNSTVRDEITNILDQEGISNVSAGAITAGVLISGFVLIGIAVIRVIVAMSLGKGHNWARILITVFVVLSLLSAIGALFGGQWVALVSIAFEVVILWLLWNASSSAYIKFKTAERAVAASS